MLSRLDIAGWISGPHERQRALSFVFVGGGYSGVEAFAELEDVARYATRYYPTIDSEQMHRLLVAASDRIPPEEGPSLSDYTHRG